jgi:hypothetical protein
VNTSEYSPGGTAGNRYVPSAAVVVVRPPISASPEIAMRTPVRAAPVLSVTLPQMAPVVAMVCPVLTEAHSNNDAIQEKQSFAGEVT